MNVKVDSIVNVLTADEIHDLPPSTSRVLSALVGAMLEVVIGKKDALKENKRFNTHGGSMVVFLGNSLA